MIHENPLMASELDYDKYQEKSLEDDRVAQLNESQRQIYDSVLSKLSRDSTQ